ncbi:hypothetical protein [Fictibacillus sp. NRS-1165]|uniref:hypothetical protein n=1 Tax=Fictibacillus sp. NRS-1165 TaxID=3144463 RepID=UPI003D23A147
MKTTYQFRLMALIAMIATAIYLFISLNPPLSIGGGLKASPNETWINVKNEGWASIKVQSFYVNNNEVPAEAAYRSSDQFISIRKLTLDSGGERQIRILHGVPVKKITVSYSFGGLPFTRSFNLLTSTP